MGDDGDAIERLKCRRAVGMVRMVMRDDDIAHRLFRDTRNGGEQAPPEFGVPRVSMTMTPSPLTINPALPFHPRFSLRPARYFRTADRSTCQCGNRAAAGHRLRLPAARCGVLVCVDGIAGGMKPRRLPRSPAGRWRDSPFLQPSPARPALHPLRPSWPRQRQVDISQDFPVHVLPPSSRLRRVTVGITPCFSVVYNVPGVKQSPLVAGVLPRWLGECPARMDSVSCAARPAGPVNGSCKAKYLSGGRFPPCWPCSGCSVQRSGRHRFHSSRMPSGTSLLSISWPGSRKSDSAPKWPTLRSSMRRTMWCGRISSSRSSPIAPSRPPVKPVNPFSLVSDIKPVDKRRILCGDTGWTVVRVAAR